jgi:hypothetical protein
VLSASSQAPYASGINASGGQAYATVQGSGIGISGCPTYTPPTGDETCAGPYTTWNNTSGNYDIFPTKGMTTGIDIYLDTAWAGLNSGNEMEWDTALNASNGNFLQDYIFTAETFSASTASSLGCPSAAGPGFVVGYSANTNNDPGSGSGSLGSYTPACITTSGWYHFSHHFYQADPAGHVGVEMKIVQNSNSSVAADFVTVLGTTVTQAGGPLYGWFPNENIPGLPIDNVTLRSLS